MIHVHVCVLTGLILLLYFYVSFEIVFRVQSIYDENTENGLNQMSRIVRKPDFCLCENKGADQLRGNREADQRLCFRYTDSTFPLLLISEISSF